MKDYKSLKITIIDYQMSNMFSVKHALDYIGVKGKISSDKRDLFQADAVILPGVGAFGDAMKNLKKLDLISPIKEFIKTGKPFMGVCLGMQLLFSESEEFGHHKGLDIIKGKVVKFPKKNRKDERIKIPYIGWNTIYKSQGISWENSPFINLQENEYMYFVHSYYVSLLPEETILSLTDYHGTEYCSSMQYNNIFAVQFHPEKSAKEGVKIYETWINSM